MEQEWDMKGERDRKGTWNKLNGTGVGHGP